MKATWTLVILIAGFWLTLLLSNFELANPDKLDRDFQHVVLDHSPQLPPCWNVDCKSGFIFKVLSNENAQIQILLGLGSFESPAGGSFQETIKDMKAANTNPRVI